jgi:ribosomal protein S18 acetylase RimI-like enzyme
MLRVRPRSESPRLLDDRDRAAVLALCEANPVVNVFVASRVRVLGLDPGRLGAQVWGCEQGGKLTSACYSGANLVPVGVSSPQEVAAYADRALRHGRRCSSLVGPADVVTQLWQHLRPYWGPFARIEAGQVVFKAEVGAATTQACQVQGVWVHPDFRGLGMAAPGMAAVVIESQKSIAPIVSLYVNDFNSPARAAYIRTGFAEVGQFMSVLF